LKAPFSFEAVFLVTTSALSFAMYACGCCVSGGERRDCHHALHNVRSSLPSRKWKMPQIRHMVVCSQRAMCGVYCEAKCGPGREFRGGWEERFCEEERAPRHGAEASAMRSIPWGLGSASARTRPSARSRNSLGRIRDASFRGSR